MTVNASGNVASYDDGFYPAEGGNPYGMVMEGRSGNFGQGDTRYKFTSKERDVETGYDYFGARYYDSRIGRWLSVDPLAEKYPNLSPYNYAANNPIILLDPNGLEVRFHNSALNNSNFKQAYNLYMKTDIGIAQRERFDSPDLLVIYQVGDLSKTSGGSVEGMTNWVFDAPENSIVTYQGSEVGVEDRSINNDGRPVVLITLDASTLKMSQIINSADCIYHEGYAHVEWYLDRKKELPYWNRGIPQDGKSQHKDFGTDGVSPIVTGSPADKFHKQEKQVQKVLGSPGDIKYMHSQQYGHKLFPSEKDENDK